MSRLFGRSVREESEFVSCDELRGGAPMTHIRRSPSVSAPYSAQQESFAGSLNLEMATIFRASDIVG